MKMCKVVHKYASYTIDVIKENLTEEEAIKLRDDLMNKHKPPHTFFDEVWIEAQQ